MDRPLVIVGGGLAGSLAAIRLAMRRPELPVLLIEGADSFGGNHIWSFFDSDIPHGCGDLVAALAPVRWPRHRVAFPGLDREIGLAYNAVAAPALDALVRSSIAPERRRLGQSVSRIGKDFVLLTSGERIAARAVIDARGPDGAMPGLELGWQKFVGLEFSARAPEPDCATIMDATVPQIDGYRFAYVLPLARERVLVEDTMYSDTPDLPVEDIADRVRTMAAERGITGAEIRRETGVLPIVIDGSPDIFWPAGDPVARLGLRGGFFHPVTGYSLRYALTLADEISRLPGDITAPGLAGWSRERFMRHWQETRFFRLLNRLLFRAAAPEERYRVFRHFYRLSPPTIARFYAGDPSLIDKAQILSGKPPVPINAALRAITRIRRAS